MSAIASRPRHSGDVRRAITTLLPLMAAVFVAYLVIGTGDAGAAASCASGPRLRHLRRRALSPVRSSPPSLFSRVWAGQHADSQRRQTYRCSRAFWSQPWPAFFYLVSLRFVAKPEASVGILLIGRALLGGAESFIITGALSWGLALLGAQNTGKVMAWLGTALWGAFAAGAPAGTTLYAADGFAAIALATMLIPLVTLPLVASFRAVASTRRARAAFADVAGAVWVPGVGLALSGVGFGAIVTFIALLFAQRGWSPAWLPFTSFSVAFMIGRIFFGHLPDKIGGAKVALVCVLIEAAGQAMIWLAPSPHAGAGRGHAHRPRLLARLSCLRRRSGSPRTAAKPWARHGRLHRVPRSVAGACQSGARSDRECGRPQCGLPCKHARRALHRADRALPHSHAIVPKERTMPHVIVKLWSGKSEKAKDQARRGNNQSRYEHAEATAKNWFRSQSKRSSRKIGPSRSTSRTSSARPETGSTRSPDTTRSKSSSIDKKARRRHMEIKRNGSQPSGKGPADWFTGTVRIDPLFAGALPRRAFAAPASPSNPVRARPGTRIRSGRR